MSSLRAIVSVVIKLGNLEYPNPLDNEQQQPSSQTQKNYMVRKCLHPRKRGEKVLLIWSKGIINILYFLLEISTGVRCSFTNWVFILLHGLRIRVLLLGVFKDLFLPSKNLNWNLIPIHPSCIVFNLSHRFTIDDVSQSYSKLPLNIWAWHLLSISFCVL